MKTIVFCGFATVLAAAGGAQNLVPNGGFESPGSGTLPTSWENDGAASASNTQFYVTNEPALEGAAFVRIRADQYSNQVNTYTAWKTSSGAVDLEPNTSYRLTYNYRRSHMEFLPQVILGSFTAYGCCSGFIGTDYLDTPFLSTSVSATTGTWGERSVDFSTEPKGTSDGSSYWLNLNGRGGFNMDNWFTPPETLDYDDVRIELLAHNTTSTIYVGAGTTPRNYDYSIDLQILWDNSSASGPHNTEIVHAAPPGLSGGAIAKYWILQSFPGTFEATPILHYTDAELAASGLNETALQIYRRPTSGDPWTMVSSVTDGISNTVRTSSPVTSFSEWAIGAAAPTAVTDWAVYE